ncbi:amidase family protein [Elioraea sp.]|uniref:amidase family protein n=1 Tax=Elioraea sp. TaxID=2185103 RepID=UPI003F703BCE
MARTVADAALLEASLAVLGDLGARLVPVELDWFDDANAAVNVVLAAEAAALWRSELVRTPCRLGAATRERLLPGLAYRASDYIDALRLRSALLSGPVARLFAQADLLHLPVLPVPVPTIAEAETPGAIDYLAFAYPSRAINLLGLPALALPIGFTRDGSPTAMQLIGRPLAEARLLALGAAYEHAAGPRPMPLHAGASAAPAELTAP